MKSSAAREILGSALIMAFLISVSSPSLAKERPVKVRMSPTFDAAVYSRLAVYVEDRTGARLESGIIRSIDDEFTGAALEQGYSLASRSDMNAIKRELKIQASDFTEEALAKQARALNVSAFILVSINSYAIEEYESPFNIFLDRNMRKKAYRTKVMISARMIGAERGQILWLASHRLEGQANSRRDYGSAAELLAELAYKIANTLPARL